MAHCSDSETYQHIRGKVSRKDDGYFYVVNGKQFFRKRDEAYHAHQSPKQRWLSAAFAYGQQQAKAQLSDSSLSAAIMTAYREARHKANGKQYGSPLRWQAAILQAQWKLDHPFEQWYEAYLADISEEAAAKTASESASQYMIKEQIRLLSEQLVELELRLSSNALK